MYYYKFEWSGLRKYVEGATMLDAQSEFQKRFGFWPENDVNVKITPMNVRIL